MRPLKDVMYGEQETTLSSDPDAGTFDSLGRSTPSQATMNVSPPHVAFDMFGTLVDTGTVVEGLRSFCSEKAPEVALKWREKQLEYMFRCTAMGRYARFEELTQWGLRYALDFHGIDGVSDESVLRLSELYASLAPYGDAAAAIDQLRAHGHQVSIFSVGPTGWLRRLADAGGLRVDLMLSAEEVGHYKPHPRMYDALVQRARRLPADVVLVSANPFDLIGAGARGLRTVWCRRTAQPFDPWGRRPDCVISALRELPEAMRVILGGDIR